MRQADVEFTVRTDLALEERDCNPKSLDEYSGIPVPAEKHIRTAKRAITTRFFIYYTE